MNIIIPMAGIGKRMRPHTLTVPKPLLHIAGKPIVQRLVEDIAKVVNEPLNEIAFIVGPSEQFFGKEIQAHLLDVAAKLGAKGSINVQHEALGTAHAIYQAKQALDGNVIVAFADTLFRADFKLDASVDGTIWVKEVEDPRAFGVVQLDDEGTIVNFVEKPENPESNLAIIGIYYFKDGASVLREIEYLLDNDIREKGEYQLTNVLDSLKNQGCKFVPGKVEEWWDCGNKNATINTNQRVLATISDEVLVSDQITNEGSEIIEPCFIGKEVKLVNAKVGPYVSIGDGSVIENSTIENTIIYSHAHIQNASMKNSMIGNHVEYNGSAKELSLSDYSTQKD
ncbi:sugar phosphate nucleotidyltransferase [Bacteroidia bacterium]|nr:sugar phosphate nucleotidyltransferase [Bacteroidia bacterium]MDC0561537.1 sugar phosphate nucleotidyltransferase [Bacteroidia bacterium]